MFAPHRSQAMAYSNVHVETGVQNADPHQLVAMLLDGALTAIAAAHAAMERGEITAKGRAIARAASIVEEGLRGMLDMQAGGDVAKTLHDLYTCVLVRLTQAHATNDRALLRQCSELLSPLRDSWNAIKPERIAA
ncbi:flagellar export chaperone FliS [Piscinibacter sp. XHJ-5]|uniref:flagellar export chaperone FliS n=1 Tax=Piscinibacter sp. XHJ-5 TaxID=3037797 RepID=UPI00245367CE|nr:flagellar export chaperone FliS [Piscinibacter sp. XHJ-5]